MPELWYAGSLNLSCIPTIDCASAPPPRTFHAAPVAFLALLHLAAPVVAAVVVVISWLWRILLPLNQLAAVGGGHLQAIPQEQPPRNRTVLDPDRVQVAAAAVRGFLEDSIRREPPPHASADGYFRYPPINHLEAVPQVLLLDAEFAEEMMARGSPRAVQVIRRASIQYDDLIRRLSNVAGNPSIFRGDPCVLATETTEMVIELKSVTALVCMIWRELNEQNQQLCQEVKEECFELVAGVSVQKLLVVACSFSDVSWCACHVKEVLTIFDALVDVLYNIHGLPLNKSEVVAAILSKMVDALGGILDRTVSDIDNGEESTVIPATVVFKQVLKFFGSNTDMVQSILATGDLAIDPYSHMFLCWACKLEEYAERICQGQEGRKHIILLNNAYDVWQMTRPPGVSFSNIELVSRLICMIQQCKKSYFDECWVPLIMPLLKEDHLKKPRRSYLDEFTEGFNSICSCQMTWKVLPGLRYGLREEIKNVVVPPYNDFVHALQANPSRLSQLAYSVKRSMQPKENEKEYTVEQLGYEIGELYES